LALAKLLIEDPEIYILDEPTNHLDIDTIEWLEKLLTEGSKTILMVTHDRYFLDNVCNEILEIDRGKIIPYKATTAITWKRRPNAKHLMKHRFQKNSEFITQGIGMDAQPAKGTWYQIKIAIDAFYDLEGKNQKTRG
jgi:ATP-binding cassette subfamily F protein uup